jgi:hypothetical protein
MGGKFTVVIADNFHYMDEGEHVVHGSYDSLDAAIAAAKRIVDACLATSHKPGMSAAELYRQYTSFGEDPFIRGAEERVPFSAWTYAEQRCAELCGGS